MAKPMKIIKSRTDLTQIPRTDSAYPIMDDLVRCLIDNYPPYNPEADGFLALIEEGDTEGPLIGIWDDWTLLDIPWEGVMQEGDFFKAIFLANNEFGIIFLIPDKEWVNGELRETLEYHLDP